MTEEEAKTKVCCGPQVMARAMMSSDGSLEYGCIGSACMAWRWLAQTQATDGSWNVHETDEWKGYRSKAKEGFCGLAGRP